MRLCKYQWGKYGEEKREDKKLVEDIVIGKHIREEWITREKSW